MPVPVLSRCTIYIIYNIIILAIHLSPDQTDVFACARFRLVGQRDHQRKNRLPMFLFASYFSFLVVFDGLLTSSLLCCSHGCLFHSDLVLRQQAGRVQVGTVVIDTKSSPSLRCVFVVSTATRLRTMDSFMAVAADTDHITNTVDRHNLDDRLPSVLQALDECSFVAIDTEFTGLGASPDLAHNDLQVRYKCLRRDVTHFALLQVGVSFFKRQTDSQGNGNGLGSGQRSRIGMGQGYENGTKANQSSVGSVGTVMGSPVSAKTLKKRRREKSKRHNYKTVTYTFNVAQQEDFVVSSSSMEFLARSGIQLNSVFQSGIPFHFCTQQDPVDCSFCRPSCNSCLGHCRNKVFWNLLKRVRQKQKLLVVHNGLLDLLFLHASFFKSVRFVC